MRPTRMTDQKTKPLSCLKTSFLFSLAPGGVCHARFVTKSAVRSYRTLSPLPYKYGGLLSVALSLRSPLPSVIRHRVSLEPGLSSPLLLSKGATIRSTGNYYLGITMVSCKKKMRYLYSFAEPSINS